MNSKDKKLVLVVGLISFCIIAILGTFFWLRAYNTNKLEKNAEQYFEMKSYDEAISTYNKLILKRNKPKYKERLDYIKKIKDSDDNFVEGEKYYKKEKFKEAYNHLTSVIEEDKDNYKSAKEMLNSIESTFASAIESSIEDMNFEDAETKIEEYKQLFGESEKIINFKSKVEAAKSKQEKEVKEQEELALAKDELERLRAEVYSRSRQYPSADYGTYYVTSAGANIRSGPSINSSIIMQVARGSEVYIYETVEDVGRTWCRGIITSNVTGKSYDGWISSRNLDYSL